MTKTSPLPMLASAFAMVAGAAVIAAIPQPAAAEAPGASQPAAGQPASALQSGHVDVAGAAIHYQVHGDLASGKTPLLVLHGAFMSADAMKPLIDPLAASRPVIAVDARGHGRSGGVDTPLSYDRMADDTAAVLDKLGVKKADVLGYSMGGSTAVALAIGHPGKVGKQVILSATSRLDGWYPEVLAGISKLTPDIFAGSPIDNEYKRLSPAPDKFPNLVANIKALDATPFGWSDAAVQAIPGKTMVIIGDADGVTLDHAIHLFKLRGGGDVAAATQGFLTAAPKARLAILPATSHIGIMGEIPAIAAMVVPFLDDKAPPPPSF
ncbi:Alpha/beta hydrolase fold [uncultured Sphingopyxis sp.]|uniref:Alpha/beta hydrolase fold n=1 Tax=uncultured Sphingopyxis sp. TaxID=310581 RepID=A0A1Y5PWG1_9SPHN|nr:alpha/beta hydrolase [uncultured Sphingopyxis sp.]SBV34363.1 Alpha/beta hydrolase fold [uncultured Sphingopyxis sp.]